MTYSPDDQPGLTDEPMDEQQTAAILQELATSVALLPAASAPDGEEVPEGSITLPVIEQGGQHFIPVFTNEDSMRAAGVEVESANRMPLAELAANWPSDDIWLAVNPSDEAGIGLPAQVVRMLPELAGVAGGTTNGQAPDGLV